MNTSISADLANSAESAVFMAAMLRGKSLHESKQAELALVEFEKALALRPGDIQAASACAALLTELGLPVQAYKTLQTVRSLLLDDADGAANLAIAAESCGEQLQARQCYERALVLQPDHLRSLNNLALMASRAGEIDSAIASAQRCLELQPQELAFWLNLADHLTAARHYDQCLDHLQLALERFPQCGELALRQAVVLAFQARFDAATKAFAALNPEVLGHFDSLLARAQPVFHADGSIDKPAKSLPDAYQLYTRSAYEATQLCDWRECERLAATLRLMLADCLKTGKGRDLRDAQHYGIALGLHENELAQMRELSIPAIAANQTKGFPAFVKRSSPPKDGKIHVGIAIQSLRDERFSNGFAGQLALHDQSRFSLHLYSPTPQPQQHFVDALSAPWASVAEIAHLTDDEAAARMRFDKLDIFLDLAFDTPWCRPEIASRRVAAVQIRQLTWHRHNPPQPCDYNLSDTFVHPQGDDLARYGAIVRFPHTCWIDASTDTGSAAGAAPALQAARAELGIPEGALVLCSFLPGIMIDPVTFASWMELLAALPDSVLWLPSFKPAVQANLRREAAAAGINAARLVFLPRHLGANTRADMLARLPLADLFIDALRFNANHGLVDALRMGVPAISCAGNSMASRLGGSIIRAAGLPECVFTNRADYLAAGIELGRNRNKLAQLRASLLAARPTAPLFDAPARIRECEAAWTLMAGRARAGLAPVGFDVDSAYQA